MGMEKPPVIRILFQSGPGVGQRVELDKSPIHFGRKPENDVAISDDTTVSEYHAFLTWEGQRWLLKDKRSKNGTFIEKNGKRVQVQDAVPIRPYQAFFLGSTRLVYEDLSAVSAESIAPPPVAASDEPAEVDVLRLRITIQERSLKFNVSTPSAAAAQYSIPYNKSDAQEISRRLADMATQANRFRAKGDDESRRDLKNLTRRVGAMLNEQFVPRKVRERLNASPCKGLYVAHDAALAPIPWELALIEDLPWCLRFDMGRQVVVEGHSSRLRRSGDSGPLRLLILSNPTGDLPEAQQEAEALFEEVLDKGPDVQIDFLAGSRVTRIDLLARMEQADIVYYIGHAEYDQEHPEKSGWTLDDGRVSCVNFANLKNPPALVFANACESGKEGDWSKRYRTTSRPSGMATSFVLAGVDSFVGATWPIAAESSTAFATSFFTDLLRGESIGRCLRQARLEVIERFGESELVWASYVLYGDPTRRFV